jgi:nucleoside-diphosphate-sugar epimerase
MRIMVTGGGGFVGRALALKLCALGHEVTSLARGDYPELTKAGVKVVRADLSSDLFSYLEHFKGLDAVFHTASKVDLWGRYNDFYLANVVGTDNVIKACLMQKVPRLIYTSSPSVIADAHDVKGVDESYPYPTKHLAHYPATKAIAEQAVLRAYKQTGLKTVALRPHIIFGPGDRHLIPKIVQRARSGRLIRIGAGENLVDVTYIDDCVKAHLLAFERLDDNPNVLGRTYFISQAEPVRLWEWIAEIVERHGLAPIKRSISVDARQ